MSDGYEAHERANRGARSRVVPRRTVLGRSGKAERFRTGDPILETMAARNDREAEQKERARAARLRGL